MKLTLLLGFVSLPLVSSLAGDTEGKLAVEEVVSSALAANPMLKASAAKWAAMVRAETRQFRGSGDTFTEYDPGIFFSVPWVNPGKYSAGVREAQQMVGAMRREIEGERASALGMLRDQLRKIGTFRRQYELSRDKLLPLARQTTETLRINYQAERRKP